MSECYGNLKMEESSPAGLSMTHWVNSYINVLLKTVVDKMKVTSDVKEDQPRGTTREVEAMPATSEDEHVARFVDTIIAKSLGVFLFEEETFVSDFVLEVLGKISQEITYALEVVSPEEKLNRFANDFVSDILQKVVEVEHCAKETSFKQDKLIQSKNIKDVKDSQSNGISHRQQCTHVQISVTNNRKSVNDRSKSKCVGSLQSNIVPSDEYKFKDHDTNSDDIKAGLHVCVHHGAGGDFKYIQHRLLYIMGSEVNSSDIEFVMDAMPQLGTWTDRFQAVEKSIKLLEQRKKLMAGLVQQKGRHNYQDKVITAKTECLIVLPDGDIQRLSAEEKATKKCRNILSSSSRFLSSIRISLFRFGLPRIPRRRNKIFVL